MSARAQAAMSTRRKRAHLCRSNYPPVSLAKQVLFAVASVCVSVYCVYVCVTAQ